MVKFLSRLRLSMVDCSSDLNTLSVFPAPPSLSVFNAPTATYAWPNLQASSQMKRNPVLYVDYKDFSSSSLESNGGRPNTADIAKSTNPYYGSRQMREVNSAPVSNSASLSDRRRTSLDEK